MAEPAQDSRSVATTLQDNLLGLVRAGIKAVPATKYALGAVGVAAAAALAFGLFGSLTAGFVAFLAMIVLMVLLFVFAGLVALKPASLGMPAKLVAWTVTVIFCGALLVVATSIL